MKTEHLKKLLYRWLILICGSLWSASAVASVVSSVQVAQLGFTGYPEYTLELHRSELSKCFTIRSIDHDNGPMVQLGNEIKVFLEVDRTETCLEKADKTPERVHIGAVPEGEYLVHVYENNQLVHTRKFKFPVNQSTITDPLFLKSIGLIENISNDSLAKKGS